jgi:stage II sporulation protein D
MRKLVPASLLALLIAAPAAQAATRLTITGAGFGHGVGMSQYGAYGYSLHLEDYRFILGHYYTATTLSQLSANPEVKVLLQTGKHAISFSGALTAGDQKLDTGKTYSVRRGGDGLLIEDDAGKDVATTSGLLRIDAPVGQPLRVMGTSQPGVRNGQYRGSLLISASGSGVMAVNALDVEDYVRGVVSGESPSAWPAEALKAQAVAARTYALTTDSGGSAFQQYADTRSQMYRGVAAETPTTDAAVAATAGQVVTYNGTPAVTYFFSTSGGETEDIENSFVGSTPKPWLKGVVDPFDSVSPKHRWGPYRYTQSQVQAKLSRYLRGRFQRIKVLQRGVSPRVVRAQVIGSGGATTVSGPQLRGAFGLFDTWAYFTSVSSKASKSKKKSKPSQAGGTSPTATPPTGDPTGGIAPTAQAAAASAGRLEGTIAPSRRGARVRVQLLVAGRWVDVARARIGRRGRYSIRVAWSGVYRVVYGAAVGPDVRVGA